jgi:hypothetical protein
VPLKVIQDTRADGREHYQARLVLVRPDQYVVWAGNTPPDAPRTLFARVAGQE